MIHPLRSSVTTDGRRMAGARALWVATGMKREQMGKPIIAIVNSFTQFVPGHTHLHEIGQIVREEIERMGCYAAEFNTIAVDDGIAMGHSGMLYSLPSRDVIADSVEYMVEAHKADAMIYYRIPVIKDIVKLRAGAGLGLGYHNIFDKKYTEKDKVIPYLNASLNWIVKCGQHLEFVFSPAIIICPSEFDWSFIQLGGNTDINPWLTNYFGLSFGIGYCF